MLTACNLRALQDNIRRLPPLPGNMPELTRAASMLTEARGTLEPHQQVALLLESLRSQSLGVRSMALQVQRRELCMHREWHPARRALAHWHSQDVYMIYRAGTDVSSCDTLWVAIKLYPKNLKRS